MAVTPADVDRLAQLSMLLLEARERDAMAEQLERIVGYVSELSAVDTTGIAAMTHAVPLGLRTREDRIVEDLVGQGGLSGSADVQGGFVRVPRVLE